MPTIANYSCQRCDYSTNNKSKFMRHANSIKHQISTKGIKCCGLRYYDKHKWINHKKSPKHQMNKDNIK